MRQNPNEKIIRMWTAAAVLTVALIFLFIASRRMNTLSEIFFYQILFSLDEYSKSVKQIT